MSVHVRVELNGDLDKPRHQQIAKEIERAIMEVMDRQHDLRWKPVISLQEYKEERSYRAPFSDKPFESSLGPSHILRIGTAFDTLNVRDN